MILIDGLHLGGYGATRGFGRYLRGVLNHLECEQPVAVLVTPEGRAAVPAGIRAVGIRRHAPGRFADLEHRVRLPLEIARRGPAVFHSPGQEPPSWCRAPWVQTLHDVPLAFADADSAHELDVWRRRRRGVASAAAVIAVSAYVAEQATALLGLDPSRVHVIRHGVDELFTPPPTAERRRSADDRPYILLVSEYGPHKGYREAFALIDRLADRGLPHRLVVVGRLAPWWRSQVDALRAACAHPDRVELAGLAGDERLRDWYRGADALVVTSRAEGFGLPLVEAMACAVPVFAFANTALPEIVSSGGTLVPDGDVGALAAALTSVIGDEVRWLQASARASARAQAFSWRESAAAHARIFSQVAAGAPGRA